MKHVLRMIFLFPRNNDYMMLLNVTMFFVVAPCWGQVWLVGLSVILSKQSCVLHTTTGVMRHLAVF